MSTVGAIVGYGCLAGFLGVIGFQLYRWFKDGQWTHIGVAGAIRALLAHTSAADTGRLAALAQWLDAPTDWLGLHQVLDVLPASLALFAAAILGNFLFVYGTDRLREGHRGG